MALKRLNVSSKEYTNAITLPIQRNRSYFFIVCTEGSMTVELGEGGGKIPLPVNAHFEPYVVPTSQIKVEGTGKVVIAEG